MILPREEALELLRKYVKNEKMIRFELVPSDVGGNRQRILILPRIEVNGHGDLAQVVAALGAGGRLPHLLDGGQEQADEDGDDGDDDQQLDQREALLATCQLRSPLGGVG